MLSLDPICAVHVWEASAIADASRLFALILFGRFCFRRVIKFVTDTSLIIRLT